MLHAYDRNITAPLVVKDLTAGAVNPFLVSHLDLGNHVTSLLIQIANKAVQQTGYRRATPAAPIPLSACRKSILNPPPARQSIPLNTAAPSAPFPAPQ
jgi:hypothetical protein